MSQVVAQRGSAPSPEEMSCIARFLGIAKDALYAEQCPVGWSSWHPTIPRKRFQCRYQASLGVEKTIADVIIDTARLYVLCAHWRTNAPVLEKGAVDRIAEKFVAVRYPDWPSGEHLQVLGTPDGRVALVWEGRANNQRTGGNVGLLVCPHSGRVHSYVAHVPWPDPIPPKITAEQAQVIAKRTLASRGFVIEDVRFDAHSVGSSIAAPREGPVWVIAVSGRPGGVETENTFEMILVIDAVSGAILWPGLEVEDKHE
jgi:hypothetical protein